MLQNLVSLWVDRQVLCMPTPAALGGTDWAGQNLLYSVKELWKNNANSDSKEERARKGEWVSNLRAVFERLESLRVGFGAMDEVEVGLILDCCSRSKLRQFGFHWNWQAYGREDVGGIYSGGSL